MSTNNNWSPNLAVVGQSLPRIDAIDKVTGDAVYTRDVSVPGMLYAGALRCPYAHAKITSIDTSKAAALPGVKAVVTYKDSLFPNPSPCLLTGTYWSLDDTARFVGYEVAAVAAVDRETVMQALDLISVQYQQLPVISSISQALAPGAAEVQVGTGNVGLAGGQPSIYTIGPIKTLSDINAAFTQADVIVDKVFTTSQSAQKEQPEKASWLAMWSTMPDGSPRLDLWEKNKRLAQDRDELAADLGLSQNNVVIHGAYVGYDGGNRQYSRGTLLAAILSKKTGRPVKFEDSAEEHSFDEGPRMRGQFEIKLGAKKNGTIVAVYGKFQWEVGAFGYSSPVTGTMNYLCYPYPFPNVYAEHWGIYTDNPPTSGFRGFGRLGPQAAFETTMNELAQTLGMDPISLRAANARVPPATCYDPIAIMNQVVQISGWTTKWKGWGKPYSTNGSKVSAVGFATTGHHGGSIGSQWDAVVKYTVDGKLVLNFGTTEQGAGNHTGMAMIAAEAAGVNYPNDIIFLQPQDSATSPRSPSASHNQLTVAYGWPCMEAALDAKNQLLALAAPMFKTTADKLSVKGGYVFVTATPTSPAPMLIKTVLGANKEIIGHGSDTRPSDSPADRSFHACVADITVDTSTGIVTINNLYTTHDVGQALNPSVLESGIRGADDGLALQYALNPLDELDPTSLARLTFPTCTPGVDSPTMADWPNHQLSMLMYAPNALGPYGALGFSEGPHTLITPAIIDAIYNAIGIRFYQAPVTPDLILKALGKVA